MDPKEQLDPHPPIDAAPDTASDGEPEELFVRREWNETATEALKEPGGAIPDLPMWDEPDAAHARPQEAANKEPIRLVPRVSTQPVPAEAQAQALTLRATVSLFECRKLCEQLAREWRAPNLIPTVEDVVLRATARAFREAWGAEARVGLRRIDGGSEQMALAPGAGGQSFREAVAALAGSGREDTEADLVVTSFLSSGIDQADPRLDDGFFALTIGGERMVLAPDGNPAVHGPAATLSLAYAPESVPDGVAATLLSRIRELVEAPYPLLTD